MCNCRSKACLYDQNNGNFTEKFQINGKIVSFGRIKQLVNSYLFVSLYVSTCTSGLMTNVQRISPDTSVQAWKILQKISTLYFAKYT